MNIDQQEAAGADAYAYPLLIKQLLHTAMKQSGDKEIVCGVSQRYTYRTFQQRIARLANALEAIGVRPGSVVAVMDWDTHRYLECYFAIPMMGCTLMMVNVRLSSEQIAYTLNHSRASTLLVNDDFLPILEQVRRELPGLERIVHLTDCGSPAPASAIGEYEQWLSGQDTSYVFPDFDENTMATTFYTTGTTGLPKAVYFSHRQLVLHTLALNAALAASPSGQRFHRGDVYMPLTPMFHVHAWGLPYVATLMGVKQVYPGKYIPDRIVALIERERVTFSHGVPTILQMVLSASDAVDLQGWKVVAGGSALPPSLCAAALKRGVDIFAGYGMSETCPVLSLAQTRSERAADHGFRTIAGWPVPLVDIRVVDENMHDVAMDGDTPGEVVARAPWLTQGYVGNVEASDALWRGGYLHTQDIATHGPDGSLRIVDRLKDVIKTGGEWVSSLELEAILSSHACVADVAVIGTPDRTWGERPIAIVALKSDATGKVSKDELLKLIDQRISVGAISKYAMPDQVHFVSTVDKTSVGKHDKKALRAKFSTVQ